MKQNLMIPRYKVTIDYPNSPFRIDDILELSKSPAERWDNKRTGARHNIEVALYPAIFKPLAWWEERKENEMPEYVKLGEKAKEKYLPHMYKRIFKAKNWRNGFFDSEDWTAHDNREFDFIPATLEEYNEYIKQNKETK